MITRNLIRVAATIACLIMTITATLLAQSTSIYEQRLDHINDANTSQVYNLDAEAQAAYDAIFDVPGQNFKVVSYGMYPIAVHIEPSLGFEQIEQWVDTDLDGLGSGYLAIKRRVIKEINEINGVASESIDFDIDLHLPSSLQLSPQKTEAERQGLEGLLEDQAFSTYQTTRSSYEAEKAVLLLLATVYDNYGEDIGQVYRDAGFAELSIDPRFEFRSSVNSSNTGEEYAIIEYRERSGNSRSTGQWSSLNDDLPSAIQYGSTFDLEVSPCVGSDMLPSTEAFMQASNNTPSTEAKFSILHASSNDKLYIKATISKSQAELVVDRKWDQTLQELQLAGYSYFNVKANGNVDRKASLNLAPGRTYVEEELLTGVNTNLAKTTAFACGLGDGVLGTVKLVFDTTKGVVKHTSGVWGSLLNGLGEVGNYMSDLVQVAVEDGIGKALYKAHNDYYNTVKSFIEGSIEGIMTVADLVAKFDFDKVRDAIVTGITTWLESLVAGELMAIYDLGVLTFDVVSAALSGGAGGAKLIKYFDDFMEGGATRIGDFFKNQLDRAAAGTSRAGNNALLKSKAFLCKIGIGGCFVKDTPVLMANKSNNTSQSRFKISNAKSLAVAAAMPIVAVPIQEVQLLDYAVAHETVNEQNNLIASTDEDLYLGLLNEDPYTSDQQRERDEYEINDTDWYSVSFEQVNGTSKCHFALHDDWIQKQGYEADKVVILNLPEQGINGPFRVTAIKHILPQKKPSEDAGDGYDWKPVTGLFEHQSNQVYTISFDNGESLGVTYQHPIYSVTAGDWKLAGELEIGEEVLTKSGNSKVVSSTKKRGSETVYNLEVQELHNFLVGESGVVVHNSCLDAFMKMFFGKFTKKKVPGKKWVDYAEESGLAKTVKDLDEVKKLERLGENMQKRMTHLVKDSDGITDFPGIDGFIEDGAKAIPVSLKYVTSNKVSTLNSRIREIAQKANTANGTPKFDGILKDITGMVTAKKFTKQQLIDKVNSIRQLHPQESGIVKRYFVEGSDGSAWIDF